MKRKVEEKSIKELYDSLPVETKPKFRDEYLLESGMPFTSFYSKLSRGTFRPLETKLFLELLKKYQDED